MRQPNEPVLSDPLASDPDETVELPLYTRPAWGPPFDDDDTELENSCRD